MPALWEIIEADRASADAARKSRLSDRREGMHQMCTGGPYVSDDWTPIGADSMDWKVAKPAMNCRNCGAPHEPGACSYCGTQL